MKDNCIIFPKSLTPEERDEIERILNILIDTYPDVYERNPEAITCMGSSLYLASQNMKERDDKWAAAAVEYSRKKERSAFNKGVIAGAASSLLGLFLGIKAEKIFGKFRKKA